MNKSSLIHIRTIIFWIHMKYIYLFPVDYFNSEKELIGYVCVCDERDKVLPVCMSSPITVSQDKSEVQRRALIALLFCISNHSAALAGPRALQCSD